MELVTAPTEAPAYQEGQDCGSGHQMIQKLKTLPKFTWDGLASSSFYPQETQVEG